MDGDETEKPFETLKREHDLILDQLQAPAFGKVKQEISNLFSTYTTANDSASTAERKIQELTDEHQSLLEQISGKSRALEDVAGQVKALKLRIEESKSKSERIESQQPAQKQEIESLEEKIEDLESQLAQGSGWTPEQTEKKKSLQAATVTFMHSLEAKNTLVAALRRDIAQLEALVNGQIDQETVLREQIQLHNASSADKRDEARAEHGYKLDSEDRLQQFQLSVRQRRDEVVDRQQHLKIQQSEISKGELQLKESKEKMEAYLTDYDALFRKTQKLTESLERQIHANELLVAENQVRREAIVGQESEVSQTAKEISKISKMKDLVKTKITAVDADKAKHEHQKAELTEKINHVNKFDIQTERRAGEVHQKSIDESHREKELLQKKQGSSEKTAAAIFDLSRMQENTKKNLANEITGIAATVRDQRETLKTLKVERDRHEADAESLKQTYLTLAEEIKLQEVQVSDLQHKIVEGGARLKQQQNMYEAVRSDRNLYSKSLIESQEEIAEMKRRFKVMNHRIEQLKEDIQAKDHDLVKEHFEHHKVMKEREQLKNELTKIKKQIVSSEQIVVNQRAEIQKLNQIIQEADEERVRQRKEHDAIISERNILQRQLVKRQEELGDVYEKIKVNWSSLQQGEARYQELLAETDFLKQRIVVLKRDRVAVSRKQEDGGELDSTVQQLEKELLHEKAKVRALSDELGRPINVHRWRVLESSDPQRLELVHKIQSLQRRIIEKTEEVVEKDLFIQEKEKLYIELKNVLGRQPGPEVAEQISVYQTNLKQKVTQMKAMQHELEMYKQQVEEFKDDITQMAAEMVQVKKEWFSQRSRGPVIAQPQLQQPLQQEHLIEKPTQAAVEAASPETQEE